MAQKLEAILCDLDDCLIPTSDFVDIAINAAIDAIMLEGIDVSREKFISTYKEVRKDYGSNSSKHFDITFEKLGIEKKRANELTASALIRYHNSKTILQPYTDVPKTLHKLKDSGYNLYIVTDGDSIKQWEKIKRVGFGRRLFKDVFITRDCKFETKCPEFYSKILENLSVEPKKVVMVGDRIDKDIIHAENLGIHTVRVLTGRHKDESSKNDADYKIPCFSKILEIVPQIEEKI